MSAGGKHTPGPWSADSEFGTLITSANGFNVAVTLNAIIATKKQYPAPRFSEEVKANARLIAAAPDMLTAGQRVLDYAVLDEMLADPKRHDDCAFGIRLGDLRALAAAIAKAEGR